MKLIIILTFNFICTLHISLHMQKSQITMLKNSLRYISTVCIPCYKINPSCSGMAYEVPWKSNLIFDRIWAELLFLCRIFSLASKDRQKIYIILIGNDEIEYFPEHFEKCLHLFLVLYCDESSDACMFYPLSKCIPFI